MQSAFTANINPLQEASLLHLTAQSDGVCQLANVERGRLGEVGEEPERVGREIYKSH